MKCPYCNSEISDNNNFCVFCGNKLDGKVNLSKPAVVKSMDESNPAPVTTLGYVGYILLFAIPVIGFIMMLVLGFSEDTNINVRNLARAYLIILAAAVAFCIISFMLLFLFFIAIAI